MDPFTMAMLVGGGSLLVNQMMGQPSMPGAPSSAGSMALINSPEMVKYRAGLLESAYNPNSELYRMASERQASSINRELAKRGLGNSGMGIAAQTEGANTLAAKFLESETDRRLKAFQAATGQLNAAAGVQQAGERAQYDHAMAGYQAELQKRQQFSDALTRGAGAGLSAYSYNQRMADQERLMDKYYGGGGGGAAPMAMMPASDFSYSSPYYGTMR